MACEIVTVRDALDIPSDNRTFQRRSLSSIRSSMVASLGGCSVADSRMRKFGPICATGIELPLSSKRIFTWAEWPDCIERFYQALAFLTTGFAAPLRLAHLKLFPPKRTLLP